MASITGQEVGPKLKFKFISARTNQKDLVLLKELAESGKIRPLIDRSYPLEQTAEAFRYLGTGHAQGKVVITMV
jgi:NADPH:quinone reductase-like Zn-dependent oxidoreductase